MLLKIRNGEATKISKIFLFDKKTNNKILSLSSEQKWNPTKRVYKNDNPKERKETSGKVSAEYINKY